MSSKLKHGTCKQKVAMCLSVRFTSTDFKSITKYEERTENLSSPALKAQPWSTVLTGTHL